MATIYDFKALASNGKEIDFADFKGKVLLIINTASKCGFTPQFDGLEALNEKYRDRGLVCIGFPCNQFKEQDPGSDGEIEEFCRLNYVSQDCGALRGVPRSQGQRCRRPLQDHQQERRERQRHQVEFHQVPHLARRHRGEALCPYHRAQGL